MGFLSHTMLVLVIKNIMYRDREYRDQHMVKEIIYKIAM